MSRSTRVKVRFGQDMMEFDATVDMGNQDAQRIYLTHFATLSRLYAGTPEAKAFMTKLIHDPEFQEHAKDILKVNMQGPPWMDSFFRAACNRALEVEKLREAREAQEAYSGNSNYGMF